MCQRGYVIRDPAVHPSSLTREAGCRPSHTNVSPSRTLRTLLLGCDAGAVILGWGLIGEWTFAGSSGLTPGQRLALLLLAVTATMLALRWQRLYRSRVCAARSVELQRLSRAVVAAAVVIAFAAHRLGSTDYLLPITISALAVLALLTSARGIYRSWLANRRRHGQFTRRVVLIGADAEAVTIAATLREHPETGLMVCGVVAEKDQQAVARQIGVPRLAPVRDAEAALWETGASGALLVSSALEPEQVDQLARQLPAKGYHLHIVGDVRGIASQRLWPMSLGYEPTLYVEPVPLRAWQERVKRVMDIALASLALLLFAPVVGAAAAAIKLEDGGPILFRQERVGRGNTTFRMLKLRSMVVDAESRMSELTAHNDRTEGPLFKLADDPRVTRCGRLLRRTSIDELPQLVNVLRGEMSLVGPRPALRTESDQFDGELQRRVAVRPGITGLWQTEARDNPAFGPYRRLDLYYVENWSVGLDLSILATTAFVVGGRMLSALRALKRQRQGVPANATLD